MKNLLFLLKTERIFFCQPNTCFQRDTLPFQLLCQSVEIPASESQEGHESPGFLVVSFVYT